MPRTCAASFCRSNWDNAKKRGIDIIFHQFPPDGAQRRKWIEFCNRKSSWKPTQNSALCSLHFKNEDYQLCESVLVKSNINFKRLKLTAVPSISYEDEAREHEDTECIVGTQTDAQLLNYRHQVCRTCLRYCQNERLISVDAQIQNMTVLEMLIQLTAFETENNDAFPTGICLECRHKLEQAFNIRQEFIAQSEHLVQLVAEERILEYFSRVTAEPDDKNKCSQPEETIITDMNECTTLINDDFFSEDHKIAYVDHETLNARHENTENVMDHQQLDISHVNDHSCYTKIIKAEHYVTENTVEAEDTSIQRFTPTVEPISDQEKSQASDTKSNSNSAGVINRRTTKHGKASVPKQNAGKRRSVKRQPNEPVQSRIKRLAEEARERFPLTTCYICVKEHGSLVERDLHMQAHVPMVPYECKECEENNEANSTADNDTVKEKPAVLKTVHQLNLHFRMHHMPYKCEKCYRRFSTMMKLKTHLWAYHAVAGKELTCEYCGKQYAHKIVFRRHIDTHRKTISEQFKCSICDRLFGVKSSLERHEASHKGERKYECIYCDKSFSTSYNRLNHQRLKHTGERPFKCLNCGRTFLQSTLLKAHQALCTNEKVKMFRPRNSGPPLLPSKDGRCPYPDCDYTTTSYTAMYAHKRAKHIPLYQCEVCNKSFAFRNKLRDHLLLHTGEKPHRCSLCDRSFRRSESYRKHMQTHDLDNNHPCTICRKSFKLPQYLQAHMLTHSSERKFACKLCSNSYKTNGELKKHNQRKHCDEIIEEIVVKSEDDFEMEYIDLKEQNKNVFTL